MIDVELFQRFGVLIVFVNTLLQAIGVPIPLAPTVVVAGAATTDFAGFVVLLAAVLVATLVGNSVWFAAGRRYGPGVLKGLCRLSLSPDSCVERTSHVFDRWGSAPFLLGRFIPGVSLAAPPIAAAIGMGWSKFLWLSTLGTLIWASVVILVGVMLQDVVAALIYAVAAAPPGAWAALVLGIAGFYALWRYSVRRRVARALQVPRLPPAQLHAALASASPPVVIDVRGGTIRQADARRIPRALALLQQDLRTRPLQDFRARQVVLYCACPNEASAAAGALILKERGQTNVQALLGGLDAWVAAGYEVETEQSEGRSDDRRR